MKAAVFHAPNQPLTIEDIDIARPGRREVLVRTAFTGLCHSDLHFIEGKYPGPVPAVLGHESAGVVEAVGEDVSYLQPGDHVISCLSVFCGHCEYCLSGHMSICNTPSIRFPPGPSKRLSWRGQPLSILPLSSKCPTLPPHLLQLVEKKTAEVRSFEESKENLRRQLYDQQVEKGIVSWTKELRRKAHIDVRL